MERERPNYDPFITVMCLSAGAVLVFLAVKFAINGHLTLFTLGVGSIGTLLLLYGLLWWKGIPVVQFTRETLR